MATLFLVILGSLLGLGLQDSDSLGAVVGGLCAYLLRQNATARKVEAELRESIRAANEQLWEIRHSLPTTEFETKQKEPATSTQSGVTQPIATPPMVTQPLATTTKLPVAAQIPREREASETGGNDPSDAPNPTVVPDTRALGREASEGKEPSPKIDSASPPTSKSDRADSPPPAQTAAPTELDLVGLVFGVVRSFFTEGNSIVRVGMLVLLVGVGLLGKYAIERDLIPIEARLLSAGALGMTFLIFGFFKRKKRPDVALVLQGGGLGAMYITVFFAMKTYELLPLSSGFALLVVLTSIGILAAASQNALSLAIYSVLGGFLAPIISSSGSGNFVFLFSYYAVLNLGILGTGWLKNWRSLNLLGFVLTFGVASAWGGLKYEPAFYGDVQPFLILFFAIYWLLPIFTAQGRNGHSKVEQTKIGRVESTLVFGAPLAAFALQHQLVEDTRYGVALSCAAAAGLYLASAAYALRKSRGPLQHLGESHLALAVSFATLAIPFTLSDHRFTGGLWALEGAGAYWVGCRQDRKLPRWAGVALQGLAAVAFAQAGPPLAPEGLLGGNALGGALIALGAFLVAWSAFRLRKESTQVGGRAPLQLFFVWACFWWAGALHEELYHLLGAHEAHAFWFIACTLSTMASFYFGRVQGWSLPQSVALWTLVPVVLNIVTYAQHYESPLASGELEVAGGIAGYLSWPLWVGGYLLLLRSKSKELQPKMTPWFHGLWAALVTALFTWEVVYRVSEGAPEADNWIICALVLVPACTSLAIHGARKAALWPVSSAPTGYVGSQGLIAIYHGLTLLVVLFATPEMAPLPYLPLLNPIDVAQGVVLVTWLFCMKALRSTFGQEVARSIVVFKWLFSIATVLWANSVVARSVSAYAAVPYEIEALLDSQILQMSLTMFWTTVGLTLVLAAHRKLRRNLWWLGAAILGLVILKLFAVDLAKIGTLLRTITFLAVGMLLVLVGYKAPLPGASAGAQTVRRTP